MLATLHSKKVTQKISSKINVVDNEFLFCRYTKLNVQSSSTVRKYSSCIPTYLHNRPRKMVKHCMQRLAQAEQSDPSWVRSTNNKTLFHVKSERSAEEYLVDIERPGCTCLDWISNLYPCKHIFMVMKHRSRKHHKLLQGTFVLYL